MSTVLPKLPGMDFPDPTKKDFRKTHVFDFKNGIPVVCSNPADNPIPVPTEQSTEEDTKETPAAAVEFVPAWVAYDRKVLRFEAYFKEPVHESQYEQFRIRRCVIYYYLEDDSMHVSEPKEENSGIPQGVFIKRHRIPKPDSSYEFYTYNDLNINSEITFYGRTFHVIDADGFTKRFFEEKIGKALDEPVSLPEDPYSTTRKIEKEYMQPRGTQYLGYPPNRKFDDLTQFVEARLGMATHILKNDRLKQFLDNDRKVLCFYCTWDDSLRLFGDKREFRLNYFLADDTIEILEVHEANGGRDPFPALLRRCHLPKDPANPTSFYTRDDLRIGNTVVVFNKPLLLHSVDPFTARYFKSEYGVEMTALDTTEDPPAEPVMEIPPHNGYGDPEDSLQNVLHLIAKPPKKDFHKFMDNDRKILRFQARFITDAPEDVHRDFIIAVYLADDTIGVFEPPKRNSGIIGGKFLERGRVLIPGTEKYYLPSDLYVGAEVTVYRQAFKIYKCDQYTLNYMESNPEQFPQASAANALAKIKDSKETIEAKEKVDIMEFKTLIDNKLTDQELIALLRAYDDEGDGFLNAKKIAADL